MSGFIEAAFLTMARSLPSRMYICARDRYISVMISACVGVCVYVD